MSQKKDKIVKCDMPQSIDLNICKNCMRAQSPEENEEIETFQPKKKVVGIWECEGYININQGSLF